MWIAIVGTTAFVLIAGLPPLFVSLPGIRRRLGPSVGRLAPSTFWSGPLSSLSDRIRHEYDAATGGASSDRQFWHNLQVLRIVSAFAIVAIHMAPALAAINAGPALVEVLRFGTDMFLVIAGFLTAHILGPSGKPAGLYLRNRLVRLVPLYWIFTLLAFVVQNYLMREHHLTFRELLMSLTFLPYGKYPVLYPAWTLLIIFEFSLIVAFFQSLSTRHGVAFSLAFVLVLTAGGTFVEIDSPALAFLTNPILIDFALGIGIYRMVTSAAFARLPRKLALVAAPAMIAACVILVVIRPILWLDAPRLLTLGFPVAVGVFGVAILEKKGAYWESKTVNFLAKCTYSIYLLHWFVNIVSDKIIDKGGDRVAFGAVMVLTTPVLVTYFAIITYLYIEAPITRVLSPRPTAPRARYA
jgi:peptidoglycan/LPS O-acetylase OafA/YrhL